MLHHVFFVNYGRFPGDRQGGDCRRAPARRSTARGRRTRRSRCHPATAIACARATAGSVGWMYMNHRPTRERVYLRYTVTVETDPQIPVTPYWISVSCREGKIYSVPGDGGVHDRSRTWVVPRGGRIVAGAAHAHGGALSVDVADQRCGGRRLLSSDARYGLPEDPIYNLSPVLHEPAPRSMSVATSATGWAVSRGDRLKITSRYANNSPHSAVMGIMHLYIAHGAGRPEPCPPLPGDVQTHRLAFLGAPGREAPPLEQPELVRARPGRHRTAGGRPHRSDRRPRRRRRGPGPQRRSSRPAGCPCPAAPPCAGGSRTRSSTTSRSRRARAASRRTTRRAARIAGGWAPPASTGSSARCTP